MPITARQRDERRKCVGASEVGALFGVDPFKSITDVWYEKVHGVSVDAGEAAEAGNYFEGGVLDWAETHYGKLKRNQRRIAPDKDMPIAANLDSIIVASGETLDAKTSGLRGRLMDYWGDDGSDHVPKRVILQKQTQMYCAETGVGHVAAFLGGRGFAYFDIERNDRLIEAIKEKVHWFWVDHVLAQVMPPGQPPSMDTLRSVQRKPESCIDLPDSAILLADQLKEAQATSTADDKIKKQLQAELLAMLNNNESGRIPDGRLVTYFKQTRKATAASTFPKMYVRKG